ncbi:hypothetical protein C7271_08200 [filamentous cyanobacterium CCP5]|nr:hypothetical protein C7271_08200 [filamentous cyanobacterium CCP5]
MTTTSAVNLENLAWQAFRERQISAAATQQIYRAMANPLSPREQRIAAVLRDAIENRYIQVVSL